MKYVLILALGILIGLAFNHLPPLQPFRDQPGDPEDWAGPKMTGAWTEEERAMLAGRYFNGGK